MSGSPLSTQDPSTGVYRSGVAARLSGVPVDTLRIWERRYSVIGPRLSAGRQRLYSMADIRRLALIKQLVDMGHPIGTVASLGSDELLRRQAASRSLEDPPPGIAGPKERSEIKIALVGPMLAGEHFAQGSFEWRAKGHGAQRRSSERSPRSEGRHRGHRDHRAADHARCRSRARRCDQGCLRRGKRDRAVSLRDQRYGQAHAHGRACHGEVDIRCDGTRGALPGCSASPSARRRRRRTFAGEC